MLSLNKFLLFITIILTIQGCASSNKMTPSFAGKSYSSTEQALEAATKYYEEAESGIVPRVDQLINESLYVIEINKKEFEKSLRARNYRKPITEEQISYLSTVDQMDWNHYISSIEKRNIFRNIKKINYPLFDMSIKPKEDNARWLLYPTLNNNLGMIYTLRAPSGAEKQILLDRRLSTAKEVTNKFVTSFETATELLNNTETEIIIPTSSGQWNVSTSKDAITDSKIVTASVSANPQSGKQQLFFRCTSGKIDVFINFDEFLGLDPIPLTYRIDEELALTDKWYISTDHKAVFYPLNTKNFMYKIFGASKLAIRLTPYGENVRTVIFNVSGLSKALLENKDTCDY